jgi:SSS family solute:Na+ symporter
MHAHGIMDYVQALFSIFIAPLLAAILFGMFWKRATKWPAFLGLLLGIVFSASLFMWVKLVPRPWPTWRFRRMPSRWPRMSFARLWAFLFFAAVVIVVVSLLTKPRPVAELDGLVYGATKLLPKEEPFRSTRTNTWAILVVFIFVALNILFW